MISTCAHVKLSVAYLLWLNVLVYEEQHGLEQNRIFQVQGTYKAHFVQLPEHFWALHTLKHILKGSVQIQLEHVEAWGIALFWCLTTLSVKKCFPSSTSEPFQHSCVLLPCVLSLDFKEKTSVPPLYIFCFRKMHRATRSPLNLSIFKLDQTRVSEWVNAWMNESINKWKKVTESIKRTHYRNFFKRLFLKIIFGMLPHLGNLC